MKTTVEKEKKEVTPEAPKTFAEQMIAGLTAKALTDGRTIFVNDSGKKLEVIGNTVKNRGMLQAGWFFRMSGGDTGRVISADETKAMVKMGYGITSISPRSEVEILDPSKMTAESKPEEATTEQKEKKVKVEEFTFNGKNLGKGGLVREVLTKYLSDNPKTTYAQLEAKFPAPYLGKFGLFKKLDEAKSICGTGSDRYYFKEDQLITVGKDKIAVCNQMTSERIEKFIETAKSLGYNDIVVN